MITMGSRLDEEFFGNRIGYAMLWSRLLKTQNQTRREKYTAQLRRKQPILHGVLEGLGPFLKDEVDDPALICSYLVDIIALAHEVRMVLPDARKIAAADFTPHYHKIVPVVYRDHPPAKREKLLRRMFPRQNIPLFHFIMERIQHYQIPGDTSNGNFVRATVFTAGYLIHELPHRPGCYLPAWGTEDT